MKNKMLREAVDRVSASLNQSILSKDLHDTAKTNCSVAREESGQACLIRLITSLNNSTKMHC